MTQLQGKTDGRLLILTDTHERLVIGVALDSVDAGTHFVTVDTPSLDKMRDQPTTPEERQAVQDKLIYGLVEQFALRWPPTKDLQAYVFNQITPGAAP